MDVIVPLEKLIRAIRRIFFAELRNDKDDAYMPRYDVLVRQAVRVRRSVNDSVQVKIVTVRAESHKVRHEPAQLSFR